MKMGKLSGNLHAKRKRMVVELLKGKEIATQLQTLLHKPVQDHGPVSIHELALQISRSFTNSLSQLSSCTESTQSTQIAAVDGGDSGDSLCSDDRKKKTVVKDRRGCYKRRRTSDSRIRESPTMEDGCAWRKYGQKAIMNSEYPRCYFRCTHRNQGCKALKQVQIIKDHPTLYQTTYFNHHTCKYTQFTVDSDPVESNLLSFQSNIPLKQDHSSNPTNISLPKEESKETTQSEDFSDTKSYLDPWLDIVDEHESFGYNPVWAPLPSSYREEVVSDFHSFASSSFHGLDMEVNQLGDIDNFHFDES